jgi:hypothetical protein
MAVDNMGCVVSPGNVCYHWCVTGSLDAEDLRIRHTSQAIQTTDTSIVGVHIRHLFVIYLFSHAHIFFVDFYPSVRSTDFTDS